MAPLYIFYNGPYANSFNSARFSFYGVTATPTVKFDGLAASYTPSTYPSSISNRLAVPCYVEIDVEMVGDASGGTAYVSVTAEQDLGFSEQIRAWSVIIQDDFTASGTGWGGYTGMEMRWMPVVWPLGISGQLLDFTGPYPQTINLSGEYTLDPSQHIFDKLKVVTFVQLASGTREVMNASHMDLPDTPTGVYGTTPEPWETSAASLEAGPNPAAGSFNVTSTVPAGQTGTVSVFDLTGRQISSFPAGGTVIVDLEGSGVHFVVLRVSDGQMIRRRMVVTR